MSKDLIAELLFGNIGVAIPTYVRNDNSTVAYQIDAVNAVTNEKRLNGFIESNSERLERNNWLIVGYIPGNLNTSGGLTKAMSRASFGILLNGNSFRSVSEIQKDEIRKRLHPSKHYIVIMKQFRPGRIWAKTFCERRARVEVHIGKQRYAVSLPLMQIN